MPAVLPMKEAEAEAFLEPKSSIPLWTTKAGPRLFKNKGSRYVPEEFSKCKLINVNEDSGCDKNNKHAPEEVLLAKTSH